ncbi:MAG: XylR N-terminal domain-containing protein [Deltaproteobacteria bacterium]|nr:XylR N-terminal domain-containing protein [Deltaproteobacteria bacterium]
MQASDLRGTEILDIDPNYGFPLFNSFRLAIFGLPFLEVLMSDLKEALGGAHASRILSRLGYRSGVVVATALRNLYNWTSDEELLRAGAFMKAKTGLAAEEITHLYLPNEKAQFSIKGKWIHSIEAQIYQQVADVSLNHGVCNILAGQASGFASAVLGVDVLVREITCIGKGDKECTFEGRPLNDWHLSENELQIFSALPSLPEEIAKLEDELSITYNRLLKTRQFVN